jgi:hypothetical protein
LALLPGKLKRRFGLFQRRAAKKRRIFGRLESRLFGRFCARSSAIPPAGNSETSLIPPSRSNSLKLDEAKKKRPPYSEKLKRKPSLVETESFDRSDGEDAPDEMRAEPLVDPVKTEKVEKEKASKKRQVP